MAETKRQNEGLHSRKLRYINFKLIEEEIKNYHEVKKQLEEKKLDIIEASSIRDIFGGKMHTTKLASNPTLAKTEKILLSKAIMEVERRIEAIKYAIEIFKLDKEPAKIKLIEMHYWQRELTPEGVCKKLYISYATFRRWRREFIELIANRLGWLI
jgi:RinA family phage transcriptional activator